MSETVRHFQAEQVLPSVRSVLGHQGIPSEARINGRTEALIAQAIQMFLDNAKPKAVTKPISIEEFGLVYAGQGKNQADDPLGEIYINGNNLFLFAATIGKRVSEEIERLMNAGDLAEGSLLDSVASEAADRVAELVQNECAKPILKDVRSDAEGVMRFSPGYCGWDISSQKNLFETLKPDVIGITLNERYLMQPLKSVSGVIVIAEKHVFEFENSFPFCSDCRNRSCQERYQEMIIRTFE